MKRRNQNKKPSYVSHDSLSDDTPTTKIDGMTLWLSIYLNTISCIRSDVKNTDEDFGLRIRIRKIKRKTRNSFKIRAKRLRKAIDCYLKRNISLQILDRIA